MVYSKSAFAGSFVTSFVVLLLLVAYLVSTPAVLAALPLADVVGIGGLYLEADEFSGNNGEVYPVKGTSTGEPIEADTPVCQSRPMLAIDLQDATVNGFTARKDIELPHLSDRWLSIVIDQGTGSSIEANNLTFFVTQLQVDELLLRNVLIREAQPPATSSQPVDVTPENQNSATSQKWGPNSGEFYLKAGFNSPRDGLVARQDDANAAAEAWLHGLTAEQVTFKSGGLSGIEIDISFPTDNGLSDFYDPIGTSDDRLGYDEPSDNNLDQDRDEGYFDCLPVEAQ